MVARFQPNPAKEVGLAVRRNVAAKGAILNALERNTATAYEYTMINRKRPVD